MDTKHRRTPISFAMLDFLTGITVISLIYALVRVDPRLLVIPLFYGVTLGLAKFFGVLPEGYFDHLFRASRPPKI